MSVLSALKPADVFDYFEKLCAVPHGSGNTRIISDLCAGFARELGLKYRQDEANNLVIWKEASPGCEGAEPIILQGHMDMVCAKTEDCTKDMAAEGLDLVTDGQWVWAKDTTLGGDNCIAVAMILAILADQTLPHPPIEAVFTTDEETGMGGAFALDCSDLKGKKLLNLDSEEEGVFTVSCAGGIRLDCLLPGTAEDAALDELHRRLLEKVNAGDIGGAEDLLFAESDPDDRRYLELAVDFYARLNDLTDAQLEAAGFGRDELEEGLRDMAGRFGVSLL